MTGFVYAMVSGDNVKIGWSRSPDSRVGKVRSDTPCDVRLVGFIEATRNQETEIHKLLRPWRVFGEWFQLSARPVAAFVEALRSRGSKKIVKIHPDQASFRAENLTDTKFGMIVSAPQILELAERYAAVHALKLQTVSGRVFEDTKKLGAIRDDGADLTLRRATDALQWFSDHWPNGAEWPEGLYRPLATEKAA